MLAAAPSLICRPRSPTIRIVRHLLQYRTASRRPYRKAILRLKRHPSACASALAPPWRGSAQPVARKRRDGAAFTSGHSSITRPADGALIAMARSGFVFFDYEAKKVVPMPQAFRDKFPQVNTLG